MKGRIVVALLALLFVGVTACSVAISLPPPAPKPAAPTVKAVSVDDLPAQFGPPDVLFIDVEGFECEVLCGASQTLQGRPDLFVEVHVGVGLEKFDRTVEDVLRLIPPGYGIRMAPPDGEFRPFVEGDDVTKHRFFLIAQFAESAARN